MTSPQLNFAISCAERLDRAGVVFPKTKERPSLAPLSVFALGMCLAAGMLPEASKIV
jgi:hypothetical protein